MKTKSRILLQTLGFTALLGALTTTALGVTQTVNFSFLPTGNAVLTFDKVDLAVGDVESVTVSVSMVTSGGTLEGDNDSATVSGSYTAEFGTTASLSYSGAPAALFTTGFAKQVGSSLSATDTQSGTLAVDDGDGGDTNGFDQGGLDYFFFAIPELSDSDSGIIDVSQHAQYVGTGTYTITLTANQFQSITGVGGVSTATTPVTLSGSVTVTVVPEPSVYAAMLGLAALGLVVYRRRRR